MDSTIKHLAEPKAIPEDVWLRIVARQLTESARARVEAETHARALRSHEYNAARAAERLRWWAREAAEREAEALAMLREGPACPDAWDPPAPAFVGGST